MPNGLEAVEAARHLRAHARLLRIERANAMLGLHEGIRGLKVEQARLRRTLRRVMVAVFQVPDGSETSP